MDYLTRALKKERAQCLRQTRVIRPPLFEGSAMHATVDQTGDDAASNVRLVDDVPGRAIRLSRDGSM
jgi:hypothetical protein